VETTATPGRIDIVTCHCMVFARGSDASTGKAVEPVASEDLLRIGEIASYASVR